MVGGRCCRAARDYDLLHGQLSFAPQSSQKRAAGEEEWPQAAHTLETGGAADAPQLAQNLWPFRLAPQAGQEVAAGFASATGLQGTAGASGGFDEAAPKDGGRKLLPPEAICGAPVGGER